MSRRRAVYRGIVSVVVLALLLLVLIPQTEALWRSFDIVRQAALLPVLLAVLMTGLTYVLSTEIYHILLKHPIRLRTVALVQVATALTSRVVPIGIGTMSLNAVFLRRRKHSLPEALAVVATNNGLGIIGHLTLLAIMATVAPLPPRVHFRISGAVVYWLLVALAALIIVIATSGQLRSRISRAIRSLFQAIGSYRHHPRLIWKAFGLSMALSATYVFALMAAGQALGVALPFSQYFMVYSFGLLTGAATPTPGGLVGVEAGLTGGLVAYGVAADTALAVALLYRLVTYWLPLIPGFVAFRIVQRKYF